MCSLGIGKREKAFCPREQRGQRCGGRKVETLAELSRNPGKVR